LVSYRDGPFNDLKVPLTWTAAVAVVVAIIAGIALLMADRRETLQTEAYGVGRRMFDVADKPISGALSAPIGWVRAVRDDIAGYFFAVSENRRLKQQIVELRQWRDAAIALEDANSRYRAILGLKTDPPVPMVTGRVVLDSRGPFANTRLANVGAEKGVKVGNPVMSERGLVGRVVGVTTGASRVLLLTDVASRTPVLVDRTDARAILLGDGGANPRLGFMRGENPVREGDRILTSGDGGVFPRGLPVGVAAKGLDGQWRVRLYADLSAIDFVRILEFEDFTSTIDEKGLEKGAMPPLPPGELAREAAEEAAAAPSKTPDAGGKTAGAPKPAAAPAKAATASPAAPGPADAKPKAVKPAAMSHGAAPARAALDHALPKPFAAGAPPAPAVPTKPKPKPAPKSVAEAAAP
jgi:rod shape-determining protein MreC